MQACAPTGRAVAPRTRGANGPRQASRRTLRRVSIPLPAGPSPQPPSAGPAHQASLIVSELHPRSVLPSPSTAWRCRRIAWSPSSLPTRRSRTSRRRGPGSPSGGRGRLRRASPLRRPQQPRGGQGPAHRCVARGAGKLVSDILEWPHACINTTPPFLPAAIWTGAVSIALGLAYFALTIMLDMRGSEMLPPPPEAYGP